MAETPRKDMPVSGQVDIGEADSTSATGVSIGTVDRSVEAPVTTNADVSGSAVLGSNAGNVSNTNAAGGAGGMASVTVNIDRLIEDPPRTAREMLDAMWKILIVDQLDRRNRQHRTDYWLLALTILALLNSAVQIIWIWQWVSRFGWFW